MSIFSSIVYYFCCFTCKYTPSLKMAKAENPYITHVVYLVFFFALSIRLYNGICKLHTLLAALFENLYFRIHTFYPVSSQTRSVNIPYENSAVIINYAHDQKSRSWHSRQAFLRQSLNTRRLSSSFSHLLH